ncbi:MAG: VaFE repeat-containing surface-anchored protein [Streptococcaceae bacterium]|jgi:LPXTG-motif cell wall-anchored protein|nr:VaFE repeat-containing surface-anchored protein [Streptococcaceae bacterium]
MKKFFGKFWRIILSIMMVLSNVGLFNLKVEADAVWWGEGPNVPREREVLGKCYSGAETGNIALSFGSYSIGGKELGNPSKDSSTHFPFCIEMGVPVNMDNPAVPTKITDNAAAFMVDYFITRGTPTSGWDSLSEGEKNNHRMVHAAMGMYFRDNYEVDGTKDIYAAAKNKLSNQADWKEIESWLATMNTVASQNSGPYSGVVTLEEDSKQQSAKVKFEILSAANNDVRNLGAYDVKLTVTDGKFQDGQTEWNFKSNAAPADIIVIPNQTGKVAVQMEVSELPGTQLTEYYFPSDQDFITALAEDRQKISTVADVDLIKPFKISATTKTPLLLKKGQKLTDEINVELAGDTTWTNILNQGRKVPAQLKLDWYYSENDYGTQAIPVDELVNHADITKLNAVSETIVASGVQAYTHTSGLVAEKYGFYYPVVRFDRDEQGAYASYFTDDANFQKPFNDTNEQTLVKWQPKVETKNLILNTNDGKYIDGHRLPETGGKVRDQLKVWDNKSGHKIVINSKLYGPFLTKPDFINNGNQHEGGSEVSIPGNIKPYAEVKTEIIGNGIVETEDVTIKQKDKGWYVWVETIDETEYTESWQSHFGSENEYALVPWTANIETKVSTTSAVVGQSIHDRISVVDLPGMWGLLGDGKGNLNDWNTHVELKGKDRDLSADGSYNLPSGWGDSKEDKSLTATFTMYYSPIKPEQGKVPEHAVVFDEITAPLIEGQLNTKEFKAFDQAGYYTIVVTGGDDSGRVAKFQTEYGVPSETVHVVTNDEYYTKANEEKVHMGDKVWDTLKVTKAPINADAEVTFTLYKYSDEIDRLDFSKPEKIVTSSKGISITKAGEFASNLNGYGLENVTLDSPGTYGWVAKVVDKANKDKVLHEGIHGEYGEVFSVTDVEIKTNAIDKETEMDEGLAGKRVTIVDTVSYSGLIPGKEYKLSGELMDKATGEALITRDGDKVTASKTFTPKESSGTESLEFIVKKGDLAGKTVVVFEHLEYKNKEIAVHADIEDENQTVSYPKVGTKASQISDLEEEFITIKDQISYENLKVGKAYTVKGVLMDKATNRPFLVKNEKGEEVSVTGEVEIPENHTGSGTIEVDFIFPRSALTEKLELVVFEEMFNVEGKLVGEHKDIEDEDQTVRQPEIGTKAKDKATGTNQGLATDNVTIVDEVSYKNLEIGKTYIVKGTLMDKATGKTFLTKENKEVHAEKEFVATKKDGTIELKFNIQQGDLAGKSIVVFETLYTEDKKIAIHAEIEDEDQTVHYPKVGTQAVELSSDEDDYVIIRDIIYYENLIPGASYTVNGKLMVKEANAPFTIFGKEIEGHSTFVASNTGKGYVTMDFAFNRKVLSNDLTLVVFEKVFNAQGDLIGLHEDINDEAQTLRIKGPKNSDIPETFEAPKGPENPRRNLPSTGEKTIEVAPYIGLLMIVAMIYIYRRRKHS